MGKRFTDPSKWRNEWFRTLPDKAKLAWVYLCDECDFAGIWKSDFGLASFQLGFKVTALDLAKWFGRKVYFFGEDRLLIVAFFEFQYGDSKDSWSAKIRARETIESLGFVIEQNKIILPPSGDSDPTVGGLCDSLLSRGIVRVRGIGIRKGGVGENHLPELALLWNQHCGDLPKARASNSTRDKASAARMSEASAEVWIEVIQRIAKSDFCSGKGTTGWRADIDWLLQPGTRLKVLEGKYDNRHGAGGDPFAFLRTEEGA